MRFTRRNRPEIPPEWWTLEPIGPSLRAVLKSWEPPRFQPYDFDHFSANLRSAISALGCPPDLCVAGVPLPELYAELEDLTHISEPLSPALLAWRQERDLKSHLSTYSSFTVCVGPDDWRTPAIRLLQALLLYFSTNTGAATVTEDDYFYWTYPLQSLIRTIATPDGLMEFCIAEQAIHTPLQTTLGGLASLMRSIAEEQPRRAGSGITDYYGQTIKALSKLSPAESSRFIDISDADHHIRAPASGSIPAPLLTPHARDLLKQLGDLSPGQLDLQCFAQNSLAAIELAPQSERSKKHWVELRGTLKQMSAAAPNFALLSNDYSHWWHQNTPHLYRSIVAIEQVGRRRLIRPEIASLCLRSTLLNPPGDETYKRRWVDAQNVLHRIAHDLYVANPDETESRLSKVIECIPKGPATPKSTLKLRSLAEQDTSVAAEVGALLTILDAIAKSPKDKSVAAESSNAPATSIYSPSVQCFWDRVSASGALDADLEALATTLTDLVPIARDHECGASAHQLLTDVLASLDNVQPPTTSDYQSGEGPQTLDALGLQPDSQLRDGVRTLQLILVQHLCSPSRYWSGKEIYTHELDQALAQLILTIGSMTDAPLRAQVCSFLSRVPPIPADKKTFGYLWDRTEKRALASANVKTIVDVLRCIQKDRSPAPPAKKPAPPTALQTLFGPIQRDTPSNRPPCPHSPRRPPRAPGLSAPPVARVTVANTTVLRGRARKPTDHELDQARETGETIEELIGEADAVVLEPTTRLTSPAQQRAFVTRQVSAMRQGVWARHQWDALTTEESTAFIRWLLSQFKALRTTVEYLQREAIAVCALMAITGFSLSRVYSIRLRSPVDIDDDCWDPAQGLLSYPLAGSDARFSPSERQVQYLEASKQRISILIPTEVVDILNGLQVSDDPYLFACHSDLLRQSVTDMVDLAREEIPRLSLPRLQRSMHLEVLTQVADIALAQFVCGDTLGVAPTPMAYYAARAQTVQRGYNQTIQRFNLTPQPPGLLADERVGSQLLVTQKTMRNFSAHIQRGLVRAPPLTRTNGLAAAKLHASLVPVLAIQFLGATGHRPTFRIGQMTSHNLCLPGALAVIEDKMSDEQHESRLVPLCPLLCGSLAAYGKHLERLKVNSALTKAHRQAAQDALSGDGPLFFIFDGKNARPLSVRDLDEHLPRDWPLPKNFLRHYLATRLRDRGCPGVYVQALLGHLEAGIQPFGFESFMAPTDYLQTTASHLEGMLKDSGWKCLLGGDDDYNVFDRHASALKSDVIGLQARHARAHHERYREQRRRVDQIRTERLAEIDLQVKTYIDQALQSLPAPEKDGTPVEIDADTVAQIRRTICNEADDLAHTEVSINALRRQLQDGRTQRLWAVKRLPHFFVPRPSVAVFNPSFVPLYSAALRLRQLLRCELEQITLLDPQVSVRRCILALILLHGVCDRERLLQLIKGIPHAQCSRKLDAVVVPVELRDSATGKTATTTEVLRGVVALLARSAQNALSASPDERELASILVSWVPREVISCSASKLLETLFEAVATAHRFESPGPVREVWTGNVTSVSLAPERLLPLIDSIPPLPPGPLQLPDSQPNASPRPNRDTDTAQKLGYQWLKDVLRHRPGKTKTFPSFITTEGSQAHSPRRSHEETPSQLERDIRREMIRRLADQLAQWPEDRSLLRALTSYALDRLKNGTPWQSKVGLRTVYGYVVEAGSPMLAHHDGTPLDQMDSEDYHELYRACLDGNRYSDARQLAQVLAYFHGYLVTHFDAPGVAISLSTPNGRCLPDVGYVTPSEYQLAQQLIDDSLAESQPATGSTIELQAASVVLPLGFATGARSSEILLREADELSCDQDQRALVVRRNRFAGVKTLRATRRISINGMMCDQDWARIERWQAASQVLRPKGAKANPALFPEWNSSHPIDPDRLTRLIGATLRSATGQAKARPYWWRHTLSTNELLTHLAGTEVLQALTPADGGPSLGFGANGEELGYPPAGVPLCQAHAANFRARRGHWSMRTSIETYVHLISLIEPHASRRITQDISVDQMGGLAGLSKHAARKRLQRAGIDLANRSQVALVLLGAGGKSAATSINTSKPHSKQGAKQLTREIGLVTLIKALVSAVSAGDVALAERALHVTQAEGARWQSALQAAAEYNVYGVELPGMLHDEEANKGIGTKRRGAKHLLHVQRINTEWVVACAERALNDPLALETWRVVLRGLDLATGCIAAPKESDLFTLLKIMPHCARGTNDQPSPTVELITESTSQGAVTEVNWNDGTATRTAPLRMHPRFNPPLGFLTAGAIVRDSRRQRAMHSTLLLAAVLVCASAEILGQTQ